MNVHDQTFDLPSRATSPAGSRRTSLKVLGAAALGTALTQPLSAAARKRRKKRKKTCGKKLRKECNQGKRACRSAAEAFCQEIFPGDPECTRLLPPCCDSCQGPAVVTCVLGAVTDD